MSDGTPGRPSDLMPSSSNWFERLAEPDPSAATVGGLAELKRYAADEHGTASYLTKAEAQALLDIIHRLREALTYYAEGRYPDGGEIARGALSKERLR